MQSSQRRIKPLVLSKIIQPYWSTKVVALMMLSSFGLAGSTLFSSAHALEANNWNVDGAHGVLHVYGSLTESACRLDMTSAWQDINLGNTGTSELLEVGQRGTPVEVRLKLQDCLISSARNVNVLTNTITWSRSQPAISATFVAPVDDNNPELIKVEGNQGVALRLTDKFGQNVGLGHRGAPYLLIPGQDELTYYIALERTQDFLDPGAFRAQIHFNLNYD